jgi:hypothetical protein
MRDRRSTLEQSRTVPTTVQQGEQERLRIVEFVPVRFSSEQIRE